MTTDFLVSSAITASGAGKERLEIAVSAGSTRPAASAVRAAIAARPALMELAESQVRTALVLIHCNLLRQFNQQAIWARKEMKAARVSLVMADGRAARAFSVSAERQDRRASVASKAGLAWLSKVRKVLLESPVLLD